MAGTVTFSLDSVARFSFDRDRLAEALGYLTTGAAEFFSDGDLTVLAHGVRDATLETHVWTMSDLPDEPQVTVAEAVEWLTEHRLLPTTDDRRCFNVRASVYPALCDGFTTDFEGDTEDARMVLRRGGHTGYSPTTASGEPDFLGCARSWPEPASLADLALFAGLSLTPHGEHFLPHAEALWREGLERLAVDPMHRSMGVPRPTAVSWTWLRHRGDRPVVPWRSPGPLSSSIGSDFRIGRATRTGTADYPRPAAWQELSWRGVSLGYLDDTVAELILQRPTWAHLKAIP